VIRLDRGRFKVPKTWAESAKKAFPDHAAFLLRAAAFEALEVDDPVRRVGFKSYAPEVLPRKKGGCDFRAIWGRLKRALALMSHQKCAYCESPIDAERSAAVEHFKPKSLFPSLAYDCGNYFLGCGGCNGAKSDRWPLNGGGYVRPDEGDPAALFIFREDGRVEAAQPGGAAEETIRDFDLNREWLCTLRERVIREALDDLKDLLDEAEITGEVRQRFVARQLTRLQEPRRAYSVAVTQCFLRAWGARPPGSSVP
jgi:uncharacterized protein (TIGR02646 family)